MARKSPRERFKIWSIDFMGPYSETSNGSIGMIVATEQATKFAVIAPVKKMTNEEVQKFLSWSVIRYFGQPDILQCDNGKQFIAEALRQYCDQMDIRLDFIPVYHPQSNPTERTNQNVKDKIVIIRNQYPHDYDQKIPQIMLALNSSCNHRTHFSKMELVFGTQLKTTAARKLFNLLIDKEATLTVNDEEITEMAIHDAARAGINYNLNRAIMVDQQDRYQEQNNKNKKPPHRYKIGDLVMRVNKILSDKSKAITAKLEAKHVGPFEIIEVIGLNTYRLINPITKEKAGVWAGGFLKRFYHPDEQSEDEQEINFNSNIFNQDYELAKNLIENQNNSIVSLEAAQALAGNAIITHCVENEIPIESETVTDILQWSDLNPNAREYCVTRLFPEDRERNVLKISRKTRVPKAIDQRNARLQRLELHRKWIAATRPKLKSRIERRMKNKNYRKTRATNKIAYELELLKTIRQPQLILTDVIKHSVANQIKQRDNFNQISVFNQIGSSEPSKKVEIDPNVRLLIEELIDVTAAEVDRHDSIEAFDIESEMETVTVLNTSDDSVNNVLRPVLANINGTVPFQRRQNVINWRDIHARYFMDHFY